MDESWRLLMGSEMPRRKSTDPSRSVVGDCETLNPVDFNDVFGGPPRSVFFQQHSEDLSASSFYDEIFRSQPDSDGTAGKRGRNLPVFRVPAAPCRRNGGFYDDIFGSGEDRRSRSRSKSNSSSVLSSEDLSPLRPSGTDDGGFASFASKLRPIIVPNRQSSSSSTASKKQGMPSIPCTRTSFTEFQQQWPAFDELFWKPHFRFSQRMPSPETISLDPNSYQTIKSPADDEIDSPLSEISSLGPQGRGGPDAGTEVQEQPMQEEEEEEAEADDDGEADFLSSFVIEIMPDRREDAEEAVTVDEAIAWAKEKSEAQNDDNFKDIFREKESRRDPPFTKRDEAKHLVPRFEVQPRRGCENTDLLLARASEELRRWESNEETHQHGKDIAKEISEGDVKRWFAGKEGNIRSLLSTLQYILWPTSGWQPIPLMDMIEPSHVRKAYQKARLCLHPDKLQQKGATDPQRHVAEKVFAILQDAWAAFNAQDAFSG